MKYHEFIDYRLFRDIQDGNIHSIVIRYRPKIKVGDIIVLHEKRLQPSKSVTTITNKELYVTAKEVINKSFTTRKRRKIVIEF